MSSPMVELEVDGRKVSVPAGSMVMHAADALDIYVPHFCYHKKLSIAANCRMCLVEMSNAPMGKLVPACQMPLAEGVEEAAQRDELGALGCHLIQGYLYARPMPLDRFIEWFRERGA